MVLYFVREVGANCKNHDKQKHPTSSLRDWGARLSHGIGFVRKVGANCKNHDKQMHYIVRVIASLRIKSHMSDKDWCCL